MENSGKQNPKMGFKSPTAQRRKSRRPQETAPSIFNRLPCRLKIDLGINLAFNVANRDRRKVERLYPGGRGGAFDEKSSGERTC